MYILHFQTKHTRNSNLRINPLSWWLVAGTSIKCTKIAGMFSVETLPFKEGRPSCSIWLNFGKARRCIANSRKWSRFKEQDGLQYTCFGGKSHESSWRAATGTASQEYLRLLQVHGTSAACLSKCIVSASAGTWDHHHVLLSKLLYLHVCTVDPTVESSSS